MLLPPLGPGGCRPRGGVYDALFLRLYNDLPKELLFQRELLIARL